MISRLFLTVMLMLLLLMPSGISAAPSNASLQQSGGLSTLVTLNPQGAAQPSADPPVGLTKDLEGNLYVGLALSRQIKRVTLDGRVSLLADLPGDQEGGRLNAVAFNPRDQAIYAAIAAPGSNGHGIWRVTLDGRAQQVHRLDRAITPQGLAFRGGELFVSDSAQGAIWRLTVRTSAVQSTQMGPPSVSSEGTDLWFRHGLLQGVRGIAFITARTRDGISGQTLYLYAASHDTGRIVRIRVPGGATDEGTAIETVVQNSSLLTGADGIAFDEAGHLYVAVNDEDRLVRIKAEPDLATTVLAQGSPLQSPAAVVLHEGMLYVANSAVDAGGQAARPAILKMRVPAPSDGFSASGTSTSPVDGARERTIRMGG